MGEPIVAARDLPAQCPGCKAIDVDRQENEVRHLGEVLRQRPTNLMSGGEMHKTVAGVGARRRELAFGASVVPRVSGTDLVYDQGSDEPTRYSHLNVARWAPSPSARAYGVPARGRRRTNRSRRTLRPSPPESGRTRA